MDLLMILNIFPVSEIILDDQAQLIYLGKIIEELSVQSKQMIEFIIQFQKKC